MNNRQLYPALVDFRNKLGCECPHTVSFFLPSSDFVINGSDCIIISGQNLPCTLDLLKAFRSIFYHVLTQTAMLRLFKLHKYYR